MYSLPGQQRQVSIWFRDLESGGIQLVKLDTKTKDRRAGIASKFVERGVGMRGWRHGTISTVSRKD